MDTPDTTSPPEPVALSAEPPRVILNPAGNRGRCARLRAPLTKARAGGRGELDLPTNQNSAIVLSRGDILVNGEALKGEAKIARLSASGERVLLEANSESLILVLSGKPIMEPVASYGPFVMNTEDELRQAFEDDQAGRMGHV